jgi:hypothetical protein
LLNDATTGIACTTANGLDVVPRVVLIVGIFVLAIPAFSGKDVFAHELGNSWLLYKYTIIHLLQSAILTHARFSGHA